ncbi:NAD(P)/FAD-dependent oxidoreductase [Murimonas intestini]|uniref:NAD(P)/FAD-dependent oxidoreductase n=1 Tax=Murimonas intestini TaxID=1337051 RepID=UPI0011DDC0D6|nr:FAD-dependent oxidoreductase [Murimonas intestini]
MEYYVIIGCGAAGMAAAERLRRLKPDASIVMVSKDEHSHSRCMLHKYLGGERDVEGLAFTDEDFFEKNHIYWSRGQAVKSVDTAAKKVILEDGELVYDKLLIASGAVYSVPPIPNFRTADNVYGFRDLSDAVKIRKAVEEKNAKNVFIVGSGLVGLDVAYALLEQGVKVTIAEMADRILPLQTDATSAGAYQELFEKAGASFRLGIGASDSKVNDKNEITHVILANGEEIPCDFVVAAAGVRPCIDFLKDSGLEMERSLKVNEYLRTSDPDVYAAGDVTGLSGIWPNAMDQGRKAAMNMAGMPVAYTDSFCIKNTINFFGLAMLSAGDIEPKDDSCQVYIKESRSEYKKAIVKDGIVTGMQLQGDISGSGFWQHLIKNKIDISGLLKEKDIFHISYADFYGLDSTGEYIYSGQC